MKLYNHITSVIISVLFPLAFWGCTSEETTVNYEIVEQGNVSAKSFFTVRINERVSENEVMEIAQKIIDENYPDYPRNTWISFLLPVHELNNGQWCLIRTDKPKFTVEFDGTTLEVFESLKVEAEALIHKEDSILGIWLDDLSRTLVILKKARNDKYLLYSYEDYKADSKINSITKILNLKKNKNSIIFSHIESVSCDKYILNENSLYLYVHDESGYVCKYENIYLKQ